MKKTVKLILNDGREKITTVNDSFELKFLLKFNSVKEYYFIEEQK